MACTKIAAKIVGPGLPNDSRSSKSSLKMYLGIELDKTERLSDWSRHHLSDTQLAYAARDVAYLQPLLGVCKHVGVHTGCGSLWSVRSSTSRLARPSTFRVREMSSRAESASAMDPKPFGPGIYAARLLRATIFDVDNLLDEALEAGGQRRRGSGIAALDQYMRASPRRDFVYGAIFGTNMETIERLLRTCKELAEAIALSLRFRFARPGCTVRA
ncbi:hypothetical protein ACRAWC_21790 [Leifsonia sp. L25]|uniref:hypothetical protein n=1 Tax=Leifsonia sp. L25 TaxID=3423957 RepID=UPI003D68CAA0